MSNKYPTVFLHGFFGFGEADGVDKVIPYWGVRQDRKLLPYLEQNGFETYHPSISPFNSGWDRACVLYAYLFGGRVDYGKVHSEKYHHERFGRTYPGVLKDLGKTEEHKKINLVGHSFGGPAVICFSGLMTHGAPEEVAATDPEDLNPLFKGGQGHLIHTATTLSGVNNGTAFASWLREFGVDFVDDLVLLLDEFLRDTAFTRFWDFYLDQFGFNQDPKTTKTFHFQNPFKYWKLIKEYDDLHMDGVGHEMKIEYCKVMNDYMGMSDSTYYFARRGCRTHLNKAGTKSLANDNMTFISRIPRALCNYNSDLLRNEYGVDETWLPSDGLVNVKGQSAPLNKPQADWDGKDASGLKAGIWYNMPVEDKDHMSWMGIGEDKDTYFRYFLDMMNLFANLPDAD